MPLKIDDTLRNRYRIEETLGKGGMGAVYRAVDVNLGVPVAVKENLFTTEEHARQFRREATILASLRHPNLPRVTDHFVIEGEGQYLVMDYVEGEDLRERLEREGAASQDEVLSWFLEICDALAYLHSRTPPILHRDIKPGNVKLTPEGKAILVDFGLAKLVDDSAATTTGAKAMTPGFSPPEQYGAGRTDPRTDIYSLAATMYAALTATIPEDSLERAMGRAKLTKIRLRNPKVSTALAEAIEQALSLEPEDRFQSVGEFANVLSEIPLASQATVRGEFPFLQDTVVGGQRTRLATPKTRLAEVPEKPRRWPIMALVAVTVLAIGAGAAFGLPGLTSILPAYIVGGTDETPTSAAASSPVVEATEEQVTEGTEGPGGSTPTTVPTTPPEETEVGGGAATPTAQGGGGGQIAFASDRTGLSQIYLVNVDGTGLEQITDLGDGACQPSWSPDGSQLAFTSPCRADRERYSGGSVWAVNVDGTGLRPIVSAPGGDYAPAWSPDGDQIAFTSLVDSWPQIYAVNVDGSERTNLSQNTAHEANPAWSPSGNQIIFTSTRSGVEEVWVMAADGSNAERFSRSGGRSNHRPSWSPNGQVVLYDQEIGGVRRLIAVQYREGGAPEVRICPEGPLSVQPMAEPSWSPDGLWVTFETWPDGVNHNLAIMTSSCTNFAELTEDPAIEFDAAWRP